MRSRVLVGLILILLSVPAAEAAGFYLGGSIGQSDLEDDRGDLNFNDGDFAWKVFLGFRFLKFFEVEGGYRDFGTPTTSLAGTNARYSVDGWDVWAVGVLPIKKFEISGKVGVFYGNYRWDVFGAGVIPDDGSTSRTDLGYGLGLAWAFTDSFALRFEYERFDVSVIDDLSMYSIGGEFRF